MKTQFYLVVNSNGTTSTKKNRPGLNWNEVAIHCSLNLPDSLFRKPQLSAQIIVDEKDVAPMEINAETQNNIREAIESVSGLEVRLSFNPIEND